MASALRERNWTIRLLILALSASIAVSIIYLPQALLTAMAESFGVSPLVTGAVATAVQLGYAIGIFLFVPLADRAHPRRHITIQSAALGVALAVCALMPNVIALAVSFFAVGLVANIAQVLIPVVGKLAPGDRRSRATGTMVGALLVGVFGGRIIAGLLVEWIGWRLVVACFAATILCTIPLTRRILQVQWVTPAPGKKYRTLLADTLRLTTRSPELIGSSCIQFFAFATFNMFWTVSVIHLTSETHGWSIASAGLFGLVGLSAVVFTPLFGPIIDRFGSLAVIGVSLPILLCACISVAFDSNHIALFAVSLFVVTACNQSLQAANQTRVLSANEQYEARANTMFMVAVFAGGSTGAVLAPLAYGLGRMPAVAVIAAILIVLDIAVWSAVRARHKRRTAGPSSDLELVDESTSSR
ncbi:MFS transporter [Rhodococcus sp. 15-649-2-2]|uniref:MFS transporter n=1 Tax=Rhodococcus sp. 15-649-2-2 TaxID=2023140 RepID=UPI000B9AC934|nr:MFS transporter [Rhodococcus sp. 15-649-2-2]OZE87840.1 MFS transporter [Rhodococcus sp. 15-649-2-2]